MWTEGSIRVRNSTFHYWVKHYEEPSEDFGIDGGRISKLMLKRNGKTVYNYDRGLDVKPTDEDTEIALAITVLDRADRCGNDTGNSIYDERELLVL